MIRPWEDHRNMKMVVVFMICFFIAWTGQLFAASPADTVIQTQAKDLPTGEIERYWDDLMNQYGGFFPDQHTPKFMDMLLPDGKGFSVKTVFQGILKFLLHEVLYNGKLLVTIVILTVFSMILETLQTAFERNAVSKVAYSISYMIIIIIAINSFNVAIGYAKEAIESMIHFMMAMIPLLFTLLASMGNVVTVSVMHPLIIFMINTVGTLIYAVIFPLLFFSAVLHIVSTLSDKYKVTHLANLLRNISIGLLGVLLTVFLGVISVQGFTGAAADGVTIRTAKYITGNFVPVVGKMFSDAADTVISASLLVKNAIGLVGVIIILFLCAFPALKILTLALIYNISGAVMQPLGDSPIVTCLQTIGKSMIYVFAALAAVGLMFFMAITIMLTAANVTVMMR
ncbi:stage III sporulation protein AE [Paenibacillus selenitireducens]|uniref:Stage III sporulation protein AE n=1 Tax=Paenibacillus selenitireducens TaxID=1324314 RepID=A0A1T2XNH6_9BACL|nr:stage III sporulation protein AE [Paenibacillus selenitireducens]OPA81335.1 stage III sporulation protein AE [Paenibacillus selenitireducens]